MNWTLFWQIASPIIGVISRGVAVVLFLLSRREKVEVESANMYSGVFWRGNTTNIQIKYSFALLYTKGTRDQYITQVWVELDKRLWKKLKQYFEDMPVILDKYLGYRPPAQRKLKLGILKRFDYENTFSTCRTLTASESEEVQKLAKKLQHRYKIGWKNSYGKNRRKTINQLRAKQKEAKKK